MTTRRSRSVVALLVVPLLVVACGGGEPATAPEAAEEQTDDAAADLDEAPPGAGEQTAEEVYAELADLPYEERMAALVECAQDEGGTVLVYGASNVEMQEAYAADFRERYDFIDYQYIRLRAAELAPRVLAEARANRYLADVMQTTTESAIEMAEEDLFAEHYNVAVPDGTPESVIDSWFVMNQINPDVIVWNTDLVSEEDAPRELEDLLGDRFADGLFVMDTFPAEFVSALVLERGEEGARAFLDEVMNEQGAQIRDGRTNITQLLAAGEFHASIVYADAVERLIEEGAPLDWAAPAPTSGTGVGLGIMKHTVNPCTAALVMAYQLDPSGGLQAMADTGRMPTHPDVDFPYPRVQEFVQEGTELNSRLLPITPDLVRQTRETAVELIEEYITPRVTE